MTAWHGRAQSDAHQCGPGPVGGSCMCLFLVLVEHPTRTTGHRRLSQGDIPFGGAVSAGGTRAAVLSTSELMGLVKSK